MIYPKVDGMKSTSLDRPLQLLSETSLFDGCRIFEIVLAVQGGKVGRCGSGTGVRDGIISSRILPTKAKWWIKLNNAVLSAPVPQSAPVYSTIFDISPFMHVVHPLQQNSWYLWLAKMHQIVISKRAGTSFLVPTSVGGFPTESARGGHQHRLREDGGPCPRRVDQRCAPRDLSCYE